uniref:Uncharacterized protein n=1 Tax=Meloidogyne enterolobii TaxID=390850 RepID=A0A6V7WNX7_MELEN|nr:unnamed protein product [Meloidogyne enterolobii]
MEILLKQKSPVLNELPKFEHGLLQFLRCDEDGAGEQNLLWRRAKGKVVEVLRKNYLWIL